MPGMKIQTLLHGKQANILNELATIAMITVSFIYQYKPE